MKEAGLFVLLVLYLVRPCVGAYLFDLQERKDVVGSLEIIYLEDNALHLTWNLLNTTGAVRGFLLTWNDGASDQHAHESGTEATIGYPSNSDCSDKLTVTVIPLNDDNVPIGTKLTETFALHDVVTNIILTPEENMISASWSLKCHSQVHTETVVIWEEELHSHEFSCRYPSTARDTTADAICSAREVVLHPSRNYYVFIEPLDSKSSYTGIAGRRMAYTLQEESGKPPSPTPISNNVTNLEVNGQIPTKINGLLENDTVRLHNDTLELASFHTTDQSIVQQNLSACGSSSVVVAVTDGAGESEKAKKNTPLENGCHISGAPTESTSRQTKDPTLTSIPRLATANEHTSTHHDDKKWLTVGAAVFSTVLVVILVFIIIKWRTSFQDFKKFIVHSCTKFQADETAVESPMASLQEQHSFEMRTVDVTRTSTTVSLTGHTYCYPNIIPRVREEITGMVYRNGNDLLVEAEETSPLNPTRNMEVLAVEANVGTINNGDNIVLQGKTMEVLEAVKLLASLRICETSDLARNESEVGTQEFPKPQAEKLGEAIRLLDEFLCMGGNSNDFSKILGRPPSMTDSLLGHGYCYPNLSKKVIDQIFSDAETRQEIRKNHRRKKY